MTRHDATSRPFVALYWDFENLHAALVEAQCGRGRVREARRALSSVQEPLVDVQSIVDFAASLRPARDQPRVRQLAIPWPVPRRAAARRDRPRADVSAGRGGQERRRHPAVPGRAGGRLRGFAHVGTVIVVGGDSDFMPLWRTSSRPPAVVLVGIGARANTNRHWAQELPRVPLLRHAGGGRSRSCRVPGVAGVTTDDADATLPLTAMPDPGARPPTVAATLSRRATIAPWPARTTSAKPPPPNGCARKASHSAEHVYDYVEHGGTAESAAQLGVPEHEVVKTLVMQDEASQPLVVLMHGDKTVSTKNLARAIGVQVGRAVQARGGATPQRLPGGRHLAVRISQGRAGLCAGNHPRVGRAS